MKRLNVTVLGICIAMEEYWTTFSRCPNEAGPAQTSTMQGGE
jgi:hypothetical protein